MRVAFRLLHTCTIPVSEMGIPDRVVCEGNEKPQSCPIVSWKNFLAFLSIPILGFPQYAGILLETKDINAIAGNMTPRTVIRGPIAVEKYKKDSRHEGTNFFTLNSISRRNLSRFTGFAG